MIKTLYRGSEFVIEKPEYGLGRAANDYGSGFYCTEDINLAMEWAVGDDHDGHANRYRLDMEGLKVLDLTSKSFTVLEWLALLLKYRQFDTRQAIPRMNKEYLLNNFTVDDSGYDVIIGYRADDSYFSFARDFISNTISYKQLCRAIKLGNLGVQVMVKSALAFSRLEFRGSEPAARAEWLSLRKARDAEARSLYLDERKNPVSVGDIIADTIVREGMKRNDPRLQ